MMHVLDYDRALGELLELDDTIRASIDRKSPFLVPRLSSLRTGIRLEKDRRI